MHLDKSQWQRIDEVLDELLELPEAERLIRLQQIVPPESNDYKNILQLLNSCTDEPQTLDQNAFELAPTFFEENIPLLVNTKHNAHRGVQIGPYILEEEIGRGGMGVVYRAKRNKGDFEQLVAIKLLLNVTVAVVERFRREQQALAFLKHPNITQLYDGGVSESGHPFLIMEYIDGLSITEYCQQKALPMSQRLALLEQVLDALAFSHKNLIVHRDIKPSNIMVTQAGQVKLLDFSIAKLLDTSLNFDRTETHMGAFTPSSSAPEQVLNQSITVATDIYQLGLLYFRLLSGHEPVSGEVNSLHELVKIVCHDEIPRPSQAVLDPDSATEALGAAADLSRNLRGDLDAIIDKMLRKDPSERYPSIEALRSDIDAYHNHRPVAARKALASYKVRKYALRNWRTIAAVTIGTLSLGAYAFSMGVQNQRVQNALEQAEVEQRKAQQVANFLSETFEAADPNKGGLEKTSAADLLESARTKINQDLHDTPEIQAALLNIFGKIYYRQRDYEKANSLLTNLLENNQNVDQLDSALLALTQLRLAQQRIGLRDYQSAEKILRESLAVQDKLDASSAEQQSLYGETIAFLGMTLFRQQRRDEAQQALFRSLELLKRLGTDGDRMRSFALNLLANDQFIYGKPEDAVQNMREAVEIKKIQLGEEHSETAQTQLALAQMLVDQNEFTQAEQIAGVAHSSIANNLPENHPHNFTAASILALTQLKQGNYQRAKTYIKELLDSSSGNENSVKYLNAQLLHLDYLINILDFDTAHGTVSKIKNTLAKNKNLSNPNIQSRFSLLQGKLSMLENKPEKAIEHYEHALEVNNPKSFTTQFIKRELAAAYIETGQLEKAKPLLKEVTQAFVGRYAAKHPQIAITCSMLAYAQSHGPAETEQNQSLCTSTNKQITSMVYDKHLEKFVVAQK